MEIPSYDPKTGEMEVVNVNFDRSIQEQNNIEEEGE